MSTQEKLPLQIWVLTLSAFAIGTAEFVIAGILPRVAASLQVSPGRAGGLITAYALAIVVGGPALTLWLSRFEKRAVLLAMMGLFVVGNLLSAFSTGYWTLLLSRVIAGLTQGPFYGIGAVVATRLVPPRMAGRAVGQMFAGLTLANVLGVPAGAWIGNTFGWQASFGVVAVAGAIAAAAIAVAIRQQAAEATGSMAQQLVVFPSRDLAQAWSSPCSAGRASCASTATSRRSPKASRAMRRRNLVGACGHRRGPGAGQFPRWGQCRRQPALVARLVACGDDRVAAPGGSGCLTALAIPGRRLRLRRHAFTNVAPMQMRVMIFGAGAPELAATANISAFNIANAIGGIVGGGVIDSHFGAAMTPFIAAVIPAAGLIFIVNEERKRRKRPAPALMSS